MGCLPAPVTITHSVDLYIPYDLLQNVRSSVNYTFLIALLEVYEAQNSLQTGSLVQRSSWPFFRNCTIARTTGSRFCSTACRQLVVGLGLGLTVVIQLTVWTPDYLFPRSHLHRSRPLDSLPLQFHLGPCGFLDNASASFPAL